MKIASQPSLVPFPIRSAEKRYDGRIMLAGNAVVTADAFRVPSRQSRAVGRARLVQASRPAGRNAPSLAAADEG
jgi:hypothetical protein